MAKENIANISFAEVLNQLTSGIINYQNSEDDYITRISDLEFNVHRLEKQLKKTNKSNKSRKDEHIDALENDIVKHSIRNVQLSDVIDRLGKVVKTMRKSNIKDELENILNTVNNPLKNKRKPII